MNTPILPLISIVLPVFNEEALLREHVDEICQYLTTLEDRYRWEVLIVNDGSVDQSGEIADELDGQYRQLKALHLPANFGVGQALTFGFANTTGDFVVTLDVDLSYDVTHIEEMLDTLRAERAKMVLASPYMDGGSISNVPAVRRVLSVLGNKFLKFFSQGNFSTLTSMVRAYDGPFIRSIDLRSTGFDVMPESLYKAMVVRAKIVEIPGRLDWGPQLKYGEIRQSGMRLIRQVLSTLMSGFVFRPMFFFILPGLLLTLFAVYSSFWMVAHYIESLLAIKATDGAGGETSAFAMAFLNNPHTYVLGSLSIVLAIQLLGLGVLALQNKRNYEELYHLNATKFHSLKRI